MNMIRAQIMSIMLILSKFVPHINQNELFIHNSDPIRCDRPIAVSLFVLAFRLPLKQHCRRFAYAISTTKPNRKFLRTSAVFEKDSVADLFQSVLAQQENGKLANFVAVRNSCTHFSRPASFDQSKT